MKNLAVCALLAVAVIAEPPVDRYLPASQRSNDFRTTSQDSFAPPSQNYGAPAQNSGSPSQNYGAPTQNSGPPSQSYGAPQFESARQTQALVRNGNGFGGRSQPSSQYGAPSRFAQNRSPSTQYGAPSNRNSNGFNAPSSQYGAPSSRNGNGFNAPSAQYGAPSSRNGNGFNAPSSQYGAPSNRNGNGFNAPSSQYGAPSNRNGNGFNAPSSQYSAPSVQYSAPSQQYGAPNQGNPSEQYGAPSNQYLPPSGRNANGYGGDDSNNEPANYSFEYMVEDEQSGNDFGHREARQGNRAEGLYYVLLPDGRKQTVEYEADEGGYKPRISYEDTGRGRGGYDSNSQDLSAYRAQSGGPY